MVVALPLRSGMALLVNQLLKKCEERCKNRQDVSRVDRAKVQPKEVTNFKEFDTAQRLE